jgi:hypothetical protein
MTSNRTTTKTLLIEKSGPEKSVTKLEASKQGIQAWYVSLPNDLAPNVIGIEWKDLEKALVHAVESGHYKLGILKHDLKDSRSK